MTSALISPDVQNYVDQKCAEAAQQAILNFIGNVSGTDPNGTLNSYILNNVIAPLRLSLSAFFLIINAIFVFFMVVGFTFVEAGLVRSKNLTNALWKNSTCYFVVAMGFWFTGFAISFGDSANHGVGSNNWALGKKPLVASNYFWDPVANIELNSLWFFEFVFCAAGTTIMTGAVSERMQPVGYIIYTLFASMITYPFIAHWAWNPNGFLKVGRFYDIDGVPTQIGYVDFAGSGVVHIFGAVTSLSAVIFLGPRIGRFRPDGTVHEFPASNQAYFTLGAMCLYTGFFAFNAGSQLTVGNVDSLGIPDGKYIGTAAMATMLCAAGGFITVAIVGRIAWKKWLLIPAQTGGIAGCVAACHSCANLHPWGAFTIGCFAGFFYLALSVLIRKLRIDDAVDAFASHFGGGIAGSLGFAFLFENQGILYQWDRKSGIFLSWQLAGNAVIIGWAFVTHSILFCLLKMFGLLRVDDPEMELAGLDFACGHEIAQPIDMAEEPCLSGGIGFITKDKYLTEDSRRHIAKAEVDTLMAEYHQEYLKKPGWSVPIPRLVNLGCASVVEKPLTDDDDKVRQRKPKTSNVVDAETNRAL